MPIVADGARHGDAARDRDGQDADQRPADRSRLPEGQMVKKGDFLAQIDPRPYQVALEQAEGQLGQGPGAAQERRGRSRALPHAGRAELDRAAAARHPGRAWSQQDGGDDPGRPGADRHRRSSTSPIAASSRRSAAGSACARSTSAITCRPSDANGIVVITQLQPISVIFTMPEDNLPAVLKRLHAGATLPVDAYRPHRHDEARHRHARRRSTTRSTRRPARSSCGRCSPTRTQILFPNQFVNMRLLVDTLHDATLVPDRGDPARRAGHLRLCRQARRHGRGAAGRRWARPTATHVAVAKGLAPGEIVVVDGADQLREGAKVTRSLPARRRSATAAGGHGAGRRRRRHASKAGQRPERRATAGAPDDRLTPRGRPR